MTSLSSLVASFRRAPAAWIGAAVFAALPLSVVAFKPVQPPQPARQAEPAQTSRSEQPGWFESADNPFLTEDQARERRLRQSASRVEEVLRRRPDVRDVTVLVSSEGKGQSSGAVVTLGMREGSVPLALVDAAGSLLSAAVPGLKAQDVTVIDEASGIRARATGLDDAAAMRGREALQAAAVERASPAKAPPDTSPIRPASVVPPQSSFVRAEAWIAFAAVAGIVATVVWWWNRNRSRPSVQATTSVDEDPIAGTLSMAMHRSVAEQAPLVATTLVERLAQGGDPHEIAQLLMSLEPWAAERLLKAMPPEALRQVEEALRAPDADAPAASVRAVAEAVLSVRGAA